MVETAVNGAADVIATFNIADIAAGARRLGIPAEPPGVVVRRIVG